MRFGTSYLYIICAMGQESEPTPCKVGITDKPASRLKALQTAWPHKLVIYELWDFDSRQMALAAEDMAHAALADKRMHGEWFNVAPREALFTITLWFSWAAKASAIEAGDKTPLPVAPPQGVGMVANGRADRRGNLLSA